MSQLETCVGCGAVLPTVEGGAIHRYMTSSAACWAAFNELGMLENGAFAALTVDAYAVHHPGTPSAQTIQSVAIHLMVLHGVLKRGLEPSQALWLRQRPGRSSQTPKHERFHWLTPPDLTHGITVSDVLTAATPLERDARLEMWVREVYALWSVLHEVQIAAWFERYVLSEKI
jgi:hypothetical protein